MKIQILFTLTTLALMACHSAPEHRAEDPGPSPSASLSTAKFEIQGHCDRLRDDFLSKTDLQNNPSAEIKIERHFQRVIRTDCQGRVTNDSTETVHSPTYQLRLKPQVQLPQSAKYVKVFNVETCQSAESVLPNLDLFLIGHLSPLIGNSNGEIKLKLDLASAIFTFFAKEGKNNIYYTYFSENCLEATKEEDLHKCQEIQSGVYPVSIQYEEKTLPGSITLEDVSCPQK